MITEKEVENQILEWLAYCGIMAWKNQTVGVYDASKGIYRKPHNKHHIKGVSDILGILPGGRLLAIEVKRPLKNPRDDDRLFVLATPEQQDFIIKIRERGGLAFVADNLDVVRSKIQF